jgi:DNA-binding NtrC family response regulator
LIQACVAYAWPGNVRELQNFSKRYILLGDEDLAISEMSEGMETSPPAPGTIAKSGKLKSMVRDLKNGMEAVAIGDALEETNWKRKKAADLLGISYKALLYKMRQLEIQPRAPGK